LHGNTDAGAYVEILRKIQEQGHELGVAKSCRANACMLKTFLNIYTTILIKVRYAR